MSDTKLSALQNGEATELKNLRPADLAKALSLHERLLSGRPGGRRALLSGFRLEATDFSTRDLRESDFTGAALAGSLFRRTKLQFANFYAADLRRTNFNGADLTRADLRGACFRGASLVGANLTEADIREAVLARYSANRIPTAVSHGDGHADMSAINAEGANLSNAKMGGSFTLRADFSEANLSNADLRNADLRMSNFRNAIMTGVNLIGVNAAGADFHGAVLTNARIHDANFDGVDLTGAILDLTHLTSPVFARAVLPKTPEDAGLDLEAALDMHESWVRSAAHEGKRLTLDGIDLSRGDFSARNLTAIS
ncbi:pentapeptide repeat-containing protein, partial [Oceanibaculum sp.]|uniref:pentapeptide repeat-containing protein n=1 Tax=Oceanibaculum sp. TaxID=1903597 RepID=UPI002590AFCF